MKRIFSVLLSVFILILPGISTISRSAEVTPLVGVNLYGGAERGINTSAGGFGGTELFGVAPLGGNFGFQGALGWEGGSDVFRTLVSGGPLYNYSSGMFGLFVQYEYKQTPLAHVSPGAKPFQDRGGRENNFIFLRGIWAHYFDSFDFLLSYLQPVYHIQNSSALEFNANRSPRCSPKKDLTMNQLTAMLRFYPTADLELDGGFLVNSFAGPTRNESGTGVGGAFGASYRVFGPVVLNLVQGQFDSRSRYRVTSGLQFFWSPTTVEKPMRETTRAQFDIGSAGAAGTDVGCGG